MAQYRKKPVVIDAWPFVASEQSSWCCPVTGVGVVNLSYPLGDGAMPGPIMPAHYGEHWIQTLEGPLVVRPGDMIIRGVKGEYYPCKPDIFEATYEVVQDQR